MKKKDIKRISAESEQDFPKLLKRIRREENVYLEQLAEGLMSVSQLARIEKGQRPIPKNLRDRLLGRLGVASDLYENLLSVEDHEAWERQRDILCAVERRDTRRAQELVFAYEKEPPVNDRIKRQFCLVMQAEILRQQEADWCEIAACYADAVRCTVPDIECLCLEKKLLSIQEINMVLEYEFYHKGGDFAEKCKSLMTFVENAVYDDLSRVKVYPKIVYYYLQEIFSRTSGQSLELLKESLRTCDRAVEMLRDTGRAFFLLELLEMKIKILECMKQDLDEGTGQELDYRECTELARLLKELSKRFNVPAYMQDCTYLYQQRWVFYIGDVLRIRREMYGLTQKQLCEGICSPRTLRRAEKGEANMQREALGVLLRKLGLSKEFQRARLVTNDREVLKLQNEMLICRNNRDIDRCRIILKRIQEKVSREIPQNQQYLLELEATLDWLEKKISCEEYANKEDAALRCTLKIQDILGAKKIYLTELEVLCIRNKIHGLRGLEKRKYINFLLHFFDMYEKENILADCVSLYEFVIGYIASELGNMGEYHIALELDKKVLREDYACRRIWMMGILLYDICWTELEQEKAGGSLAEKNEMTECLIQSKLLSHFCKQNYHEKFFDDKINQL